VLIRYVNREPRESTLNVVATSQVRKAPMLALCENEGIDKLEDKEISKV
jgi:hypothetical protein